MIDMCGLFGSLRNADVVWHLARRSARRGSDSSGLVYFRSDRTYAVRKRDASILELERLTPERDFAGFVMGHCRLVTNSVGENQPVCRDGLILIHNGIVLNGDELFDEFEQKRQMSIDSEALLAPFIGCEFSDSVLRSRAQRLLALVRGSVSMVLLIPEAGKVLLLSNTGSLYLSEQNDDFCFASEKTFLAQAGRTAIRQVKNDVTIKNVDIGTTGLVDDVVTQKRNLVPSFNKNSVQASMLEYPDVNLKRCTRCVLPETMPHIDFDEYGVCNYCRHYQPRNQPKPLVELESLLERYRRNDGSADCIMPFSGGRDSCFALHLAIEELGMRPLTYTYDWGMVTDLGRRNISLMCGELGVENILIAADIKKKRENIRKNLKAWLETPHLGLISLLTAGDKHFFRYVRDIKEETGISIDLWGVNPLEVTHFKAGFLGIKPNFLEDKVYNNGLPGQFRYHMKRFSAMSRNIKYFNTSLWDTLSGEYFRSVAPKDDYFHVFDYWRWDESEVDSTLEGYGWERAVDTSTTWRIGDGTAAFYNYIYYLMAGFTEHDTFRSNQIREGQMDRGTALDLVRNENRPRYENIRWYLDVVGLDYTDVIRSINSIPRMY